MQYPVIIIDDPEPENLFGPSDKELSPFRQWAENSVRVGIKVHV